ncbi:MAG: NAD(+)/NADH kinase [Treponema sp.]|nr:NAD(+)/NADH kinase [Treponema sp.]
MNAVLFINLFKKEAAGLAEQIKETLEKRGVNVTLYSFEGKSAELPQGLFDIAFSLGGDGTVLYTARCLAQKNIPILPVNLGTFGFIAEVNIDEWLTVFDKWQKGDLQPVNRCMFQITVERGSKTIMNNVCLNDAVVSYTEIAKLIKIDVCFGDTDLGTYRCDGFVVATPTGSTAYSMAAGGPILDPEMEAMILNPICPFALSNRPLVVPSRQTLVITVAEKQRSGVLLTIDGQDTFALEHSDKIYIKQAPFCAQLIYNGRSAYYSALRSKLFLTAEDDRGNHA